MTRASNQYADKVAREFSPTAKVDGRVERPGVRGGIAHFYIDQN